MSDLKYIYEPHEDTCMSLEEAIEYNEEIFQRYYKCYAITQKEIFYDEMEQRAEFLDAARASPKNVEFI